MTEITEYLIIGNSAGGIGAAEAIREVDRAGSIAIVSDEPYPAYSRPLISEYLVSRCPLERMLFRPPDFYQQHGIQAILGRRVARLDAGRQTISLEDGSTLAWKKLLLATGGQPVVPNIEGVGLQGVFTFTTLDDARAIDQFLRPYRRKTRAVVIGGGLIGVSVSEALVKRGVEVTIVEMKERLLNTILDAEASALVEPALKASGVEVVTGRTVGEVGSYLRGEATGVTLDDSRPLPCEVVVVAIGVQPRLELVRDSGIRTGRGIVVDRHMQTSLEGVYACGDVAEAYDFVSGENRLTPVWPNAYLGGRTAGFNMAGVPAEYPGGTAMNALKYFGVNIVSAGMVAPPDDSYEIVRARSGGSYRKVVLKDGLIAGFVFSGELEKSGIIYHLMKDRVNVGAFQQALVAADFGLASLPPEIWRARLAVPASIAPASPAEPVKAGIK